MTKKVILWDVMDTLVSDPILHVIPGFFGMTLQELIKVKHPTAWVDFECGKISDEDYLHSCFADERHFDHQGFCERVRNSYEWLPGMEALLSELKRSGHAMYALSNYPEWYLWIEDKLRLSRYLSWDFVSCQTGLRKPDPRAYQNVIERLSVSPHDCIFIDDRAVNCEAASLVGIRAILFENADQARAELAKHELFS